MKCFLRDFIKKKYTQYWVDNTTMLFYLLFLNFTLTLQIFISFLSEFFFLMRHHLLMDSRLCFFFVPKICMRLISDCIFFFLQSI